MINPVLVAKSPRPKRTNATNLFNDIEAGISGILSAGGDGEDEISALTGDEAFDDEYGLGQHLIAIARELSTSVTIGKYEDELIIPGTASTVALRARGSGLLGNRTEPLTLNRQVTNPKTLGTDGVFPVLPMAATGS